MIGDNPDIKKLTSSYNIFSKIKEQDGIPPNWQRPEGFVSFNIILLAMISDEERADNSISKLDYDILEENYKILQQATDINENYFKSSEFRLRIFMSRIILRNLSSAMNGELMVV